jgi:hypothetical protein
MHYPFFYSSVGLISAIRELCEFIDAFTQETCIALISQSWLYGSNLLHISLLKGKCIKYSRV